MRIKLAQRQHDDPELDPVIRLFVGVVRQAQRDLAFSSKAVGGLSPSQQDRASAAEFLEEMMQSATRRTE